MADSRCKSQKRLTKQSPPTGRMRSLSGQDAEKSDAATDLTTSERKTVYLFDPRSSAVRTVSAVQCRYRGSRFLVACCLAGGEVASGRRHLSRRTIRSVCAGQATGLRRSTHVPPEPLVERHTVGSMNESLTVADGAERPREKSDPGHDVVSGCRRIPAHQRMGAACLQMGGDALQVGVGGDEQPVSHDYRWDSRCSSHGLPVDACDTGVVRITV